MSKISEIIVNEIIKEYSNGVRVKDLSIKYNISQQTINKYLNTNFVDRVKYESSKKFSKEKEESIIKLYREGKDTKSIAKLFNTYNTSIRRVLVRNNIKLRSNHNVLRMCKHNPFKRNDEYSEYFLGLLLTDGCITHKDKDHNNLHINLSLSEIDSYMVENFRDWASPSQKITKIKQKINNTYMYSINISNQEAIEWLMRKGNFVKKSYNCKLYTKMTWNILRGILDGDGGFYFSSSSKRAFICGASKDFISQIHNFFTKNNITSYIQYYSDRNLYYINIYKTEDIIKLGKLMYDNAHIYLKRKYDKWLAFYESKKEKDLNSGKEIAIQP